LKFDPARDFFVTFSLCIRLLPSLWSRGFTIVIKRCFHSWHNSD
jgi:hypothetical protein